MRKNVPKNARENFPANAGLDLLDAALLDAEFSGFGFPAQPPAFLSGAPSARVARKAEAERGAVTGAALDRDRAAMLFENAPVEKASRAGRDVLFDIHWQGTQQLREKARNDLVSVFILPPSVKKLECGSSAAPKIVATSSARGWRKPPAR